MDGYATNTLDSIGSAPQTTEDSQLKPRIQSAVRTVAILLALVMHILDSGFGLILMFLPLSYVAQCVKQALAEPRPPVGDVAPLQE